MFRPLSVCVGLRFSRGRSTSGFVSFISASSVIGIAIGVIALIVGMAVEFIFPFVHGCHLFFLTRLPSPAIIAQAFADIHPAIVISVPLVVEKIIRKMVFPKIQNNKVRLLWNMPVINKKVKERICQMVMLPASSFTCA